MSRVSERVLDASPPVEDDREIRSLHVAPSLAMSTDVAEERDSQPAQRDELAHSHTVPIGDGVSSALAEACRASRGTGTT